MDNHAICKLREEQYQKSIQLLLAAMDSARRRLRRTEPRCFDLALKDLEYFLEPWTEPPLPPCP